MLFDDLERMSFAPIFGQRVASGQGGPAAPAELDYGPAREFDLLKGKVKPLGSRYRNPLTKFRVERTSACIACGKCAEVCGFGVHKKAGQAMLGTRARFCMGAEYCKARGAYCVETCPVGALRVGPNPVWKTFGDPRWPADLLVATWEQAETGRPPASNLEYRVGQSGGGFDRLDFLFPAEAPDKSFAPAEVDLTVPLNRRRDEQRPRITIGWPIYGGGMSFGSVSLSTMVSRGKAFATYDSFTCTGEGGYPDVLKPYDDHVITQVATGLFGVREETIQRVRIVEFKYAQEIGRAHV
jgi:ferredoxin